MGIHVAIIYVISLSMMQSINMCFHAISKLFNSDIQLKTFN